MVLVDSYCNKTLPKSRRQTVVFGHVLEQTAGVTLREKKWIISVTVKATSHSAVFDIPMRLVHDDQRHRRRFTR